MKDFHAPLLRIESDLVQGVQQSAFIIIPVTIAHHHDDVGRCWCCYSVMRRALAWCVLWAWLAQALGLPSLLPGGSSRPDNVRLDLAELEKMGIKAEDLLMHLAQGNYICSMHNMADMRKHFIRNHAVTCNDGSKAG